jgi:hypothetical protein
MGAGFYCLRMPFSLDPDRELPAKRLGAVMGLYDGPLHRDWLAWWTIGWTLVAGLSIAFPTQGTQRTSTLPLWLDLPLAAVVFGTLFGVLPAYLRLLVRRRRLRRQRAEVNARSATAHERSTPQASPPSSQEVEPREVAPPQWSPARTSRAGARTLHLDLARPL